MTLDERLELISAIERVLAVSTSDAIEVLELAQLDPLWPFRHNPDAFEDTVRFCWIGIRLERERGPL